MNQFYLNKESHLHISEFEGDDYGNAGFIFHDFDRKSFDLLLYLFKRSKHSLVETVTMPPLRERLKGKNINDFLGPSLLSITDPLKAYEKEQVFLNSPGANKAVEWPVYKFDLPFFFKYLNHKYPQVRKAYMTKDEYNRIMPVAKPRKFIPKRFIQKPFNS